MATTAPLAGLLQQSAAKFPDKIALDDTHGQLSYAELERLAQAMAAELARCGVAAGDRVGLYLTKSLASVVTIFGALKCGAAYVPVDASAPPARNSFIFNDCASRVVVVDARYLEGFTGALDAGLDFEVRETPLLREFGLELKLVVFGARAAAVSFPEQLAYILYTSGSTGKPKGVMHTHASAMGFIDWCTQEFAVSAADVFSSHAPFHFDLSIFDIYVAVKTGATLVLIGEAAGKQPMELAELISAKQISVWYSTPSILRLLVEFGRLAEKDYAALRLVLFAGETYPLKQYFQLRQFWQQPVFYNLYGPTETNVCTFYRVPGELAAEAFRYFPIGIACSGDELKIVDEQFREVAPSQPGELLVRGASVMAGYWNLPQQNDKAFVMVAGAAWYRTGDIVVQLADGNIDYISRRDRMIKRRGYRVELGEIEAALYQLKDCIEAAAVAVTDSEGDIKVCAYLCVRGESPPGIIALKTFCAANLPAYMIPDTFKVLPSLPKTSTDKIDYQQLKEL